MKNCIVLVGLFVAFSALAQDVQEEGWKGKVRPFLEKVLGAETTVRFIGEPPAPPVEWVLPALPKLEKQTTDTSVYRMDSDLRKQGKEFDSLPKEKKRSYDIAFLRELFLATRRAPAKDDDLAKWINVLEGGGSREGIYRGLVLDEVYASLESYQEVPSQKLLSWVDPFTKKYLGLAFAPEVLKQGNLFFIKRVVTEKVLEMLDTLEKSPEDFRKWYAIFSSDLAKEFPALFKEGIRANTNPEVHLQWATKAPIQHIKSEAVVKLHLVMNVLQDAQ